MGYLLKEALKTLCGVNQWSYAVFWKFGCQNPKFLIWEDCYYEPPSCSGNSETAFQDIHAFSIPAEIRYVQSRVQGADKVHFLVNKMMMDNHVNILGEGLVGRVPLTGNYQWILSEKFITEGHPPEVLKEAWQQFSAGMQTVVVIPVVPHGVVQFGSYKTIMENIRFVNDVTSLICQLGCIPGVWLSEDYAAKEVAPDLGNSNHEELSSFCDSSNYILTSAHTSVFDSPNQVMNRVAKAQVIPSNSETWMNRHTSLFNHPFFNFDSCSSSTLNHATISTERKISTDTGNTHPDVSIQTNPTLIYTSNDCSVTLPSVQVNGMFGIDSVPDAKKAAIENITSMHLTSSELSSMDLPTSKNSDSDSIDHLIRKSFHSDLSRSFSEDDRKQKVEDQFDSMSTKCNGDASFHPQSGDDLFDILGIDFKNNLLGSFWNSSLSKELALNAHNWENKTFPFKNSMASSEMYSTCQHNSDSGISSLNGADHLLDAAVPKVHPSAKQSLDDSVSCKTTLTNISSSSAVNTNLPYGRFGVSDHTKGELCGGPKYEVKAGGLSSRSLINELSKEDSVTYSRGSSVYGSQASSWIEKGKNSKQSNSVSTRYSKRPDEMGKTNRKRLKPGENQRPRPKDRQMIQDRVKELREIVPNGAKCSIDALLECTIKHMLFLQSVTKHADKLKNMGESKIIGKDGNLLSKENFEGGATWAYEVGSQSMVCPIIVEDLNQPRRLRVKMLCEERGLFLEIADIIRGLGLTILKGVMETRNDKIWACFAVEANRDITRMEIFLSLVHLLDQSAKTDACQTNVVINENMQTLCFPLA